jgi:hypothetical protein
MPDFFQVHSSVANSAPSISKDAEVMFLATSNLNIFYLADQRLILLFVTY